MAHRPPRGTSTLLVLVASALPASAEDRVSVRAAYYREASTRVVQPMLQVSKDLPQGFDVGAHLLVDAITSASIAQGAVQDELFHENRYEGSVSVGKTWNHTRLGGFFRYSHEPDYFSRTAGLSLSQDVWGNTGTVSANLAFTHDDISPPPPLMHRDLNVFFGGVSYAQVLTPTTVAQAGYELFYLQGFMGNPYISHPDLGREKLPERRLRHALALRVAQYVPRFTLGAQLHYRFYLDSDLNEIGPWGLRSHSVETRLYKGLGRDFEVRLSYRYHSQGSARFWCNSDPSSGGRVSCYVLGLPSGVFPQYHSVDAKFGALATHLPEIKLIWDLRAFADVPFLQHLAAGSFEVSYGFFIQSSRYGQRFTERTAPPFIGTLPFVREYGGAHLIQTGYTLPF
jgi:hypothetical protein